MQIKITATYDTDSTLDEVDGVNDSISKILWNSLPYMVDNLDVKFEVVW